MEGNLLHWQQSWADFYHSEGDSRASDPYVQCAGAGYDIGCSPLPTDCADIMLVPPMQTPAGLFQQGTFRDMADFFQVDTLGAPQGNTSFSLRQQANQQLSVNTQLDLFDDPESSTASSNSLFQALATPYLQGYPTPLPHLHVQLSPQSSPADSGTLMPDLENLKMSPLPTSPMSLYSPAGDGDFDFLTSQLPIEPDVVTQTPLPHILEWKRVIEVCGTGDFVPQGVYQPYTEADRKRYIRDVALQETIFFIAEGSTEPGIAIDDALKQKLRHLRDKEDRMFVGCGPSVSIRIQWPGYQPWSKQIPTQDFKTPKGPITRGKLVKNIATCIRRFAESVQDKPMEAESDKRWKIGKGHVRLEDLILVSLHHVSKGSWQPQLRLRRSPLSVAPLPSEFPSAIYPGPR